MTKTADQIATERQSVCDEARSWLRTPFHHEGTIKGVGVDCGQYLIQVYHNAGLIPLFETGHYPFDWALHNDQERYLNFVLQYAHEIATDPLPGDLVLWKQGRCFSHGAIVLDWPTILHAQVGVGIVLANAVKEEGLLWVGHPGQEKPRGRLVCSLWD
jgi:cell wall-associated NlpC family hydrolase